MRTKLRMQGNSLALTVPKSFRLSAGLTVEPELTDEGIFYRFVPIEDPLDFEADILRDVISEGYSGEELVVEFQKRKAQIPVAFAQIAKEARGEKVMTREEMAHDSLAPRRHV